MKNIQKDVREIIAGLPHTKNPQTGENYLNADWVKADNGYPFYVRAAEVIQPERILEVGSFLGFGLVAFRHGFPDVQEITSVDNETYLPGSRRLSVENVRSTGGKVKVMAYSHISDLPYYADEEAMLHVDAHHTFEDALHDITQCWAMRPRVMLVDDFLFIHDVKRAVEFFALRNQLPYKIWHSYRGWAVFAEPETFDALPENL